LGVSLKSTILLAFGLMLVFEGLLPFIAPQAWRETFKRMIELKDGQLRFVGIISITGGLLLMLFA
jgi:uncharacterized protein YjeT (DUF2065 family)